MSWKPIGVPRALRFIAAMPLAWLAGCNMVVMHPTGDIAIQERNLILVALGMMLLVVVPVMTLTIAFAWRYRKGHAPGLYDPDFDHSTRIELVVWSIPLLIIAGLAVITWRSTHALDPFRPLDRIAAGRPVPAGTRPLDIQVVAMDWKWLFIYPGQGVATINDLALPLDVPVRFSITSTSQMNTFYAPTLAGMIYAMPGMQSQLNAVLNEAGDSWGYSGNYTGRGYSDMRFRLHGLDRAGFARWVSQAKASNRPLSDGLYRTLETPSEKDPVQRFASVAPGLFDRVLNRCVAPGTRCAADVMRRDRRVDGDQGGLFAIGGPVPSTHEALPPAAARVPGALQTAPGRTGPTHFVPGQSVGHPARPGAPGETRPGDPRNRNLTATIPLPVPGVPRSGRA